MDQSSLYFPQKKMKRERKEERGREGEQAKGERRGWRGKVKKMHLLMHVDKCIKWKGENGQL